MPINDNESIKRLKARRIPDINLSAVEVDRINRTTPNLTPEERKINRMYSSPVNDASLWKKIAK